MPRKPMPWFRFYVGAVRDTKLRRLPAGQRWVWVAILAASRESCRPGYLLVSEREPMTDRDLADLAGVTVGEVRKALAAFEAADMIDRPTPSDPWHVTNWDERQYQSDTSTDRTRRHRTKGTGLERSNDVPGTVEGTDLERSPSVQRTDTDTDLHPPSTNGCTRPEPDGGGLIEQAVAMAATRYARHQVEQGKGSSEQGLASWWLQENAEGARLRARRLLDDFDLTATQLADALGSASPRWLEAYRRRDVMHDLAHAEPPDQTDMAAVADIAAGVRQRLAHRAGPSRADGETA